MRYRSLSQIHRFYLATALVLTVALVVVLVRFGVSWPLAYLAGINVITMCFYGFDKLQAVQQASRVPELVLHALGVLGGTPGGFAAQLLFRHKTRAPRFRGIFFAIVALQVGIVLAYIWNRGL